MERMLGRMTDLDTTERARYSIGGEDYMRLSSEEQTKVSADIEDSMRNFVTRMRSATTDAPPRERNVLRAQSAPE
jgi:type IV secretory pathway TrbF-like protein